MIYISAFFFTAYLIYIRATLKKWPWSISKSYYEFGKDHRFAVGTLLYAVPLIFAEPLLIRIAGVFLTMVAAAPRGRGKNLEAILHVIGADLPILLASVHLFCKGIEGDIWAKIILWGLTLIMVGYIIYALKKRIDKRTLKIEAAAFYLLMLGAGLYPGTSEIIQSI
jgi:uncharacterized membrane protein